MEHIIQHLHQSGLFAGLNDDMLRRIAARFEKTTFEKGDVIFQEDDSGDRMFIVTKGKVAVLKNMGWGQRELQRLSPVEMFGEMALISLEKRTATLKAVEYTECLTLTQEHFNEILNQDAKFAQQILRVLTTRLRQVDEQTTKDLVQSHKSLIFALADLADSRDPETGGHLKRVRGYCARLAELLLHDPRYAGVLTPAFVEGIFFVAPLHDIGKVAIPDAILQKPGKLTDEEFEIMKTHSATGAQTLQGVTDRCENETFRMAYRLTRHHHERWDGRGYPDGLAGEAIPLEARIMAQADVYDALLAKRVYKPAMPHDKAVDILREGMGTQFDAHIMGVMLDNIEDFRAIHEKYGE